MPYINVALNIIINWNIVSTSLKLIKIYNRMCMHTIYSIQINTDINFTHTNWKICNYFWYLWCGCCHNYCKHFFLRYLKQHVIKMFKYGFLSVCVLLLLLLIHKKEHWIFNAIRILLYIRSVCVKHQGKTDDKKRNAHIWWT